MIKHAWFGLVLAAMLAGCDAQPPCDASTCSGCCDTEGSCQPGDTQQLCGRGAAACGQCGPGLTCTAGGCGFGNPGTGGGRSSSGGGSGGGTATGGGGGGGGNATGGGGSATGGGGSATGGGGSATGGGGGSSTGGGGGPTCASSGGACGTSANCCSGLQCINGQCGTCSGEYPTYCPQEGGGCWTSNTACSTIVTCADDGRRHACTQSVLSYSCSTDTCACPSSSYPVYCAPTGSLPAQCWSANTDCSTRTQCGSMIISCAAGYTVDCATNRCVSNIPSWVAGTYSKRGKTENNVEFTSDNRSLTLRSDGTYSYAYGSSSTSSGTFTYNATSRSVLFSGGQLSGTSTSFGDSCRTVPSVAYGAYRSSEVPNCPTSARVPASACGYVGRYRKVSTSGSISSSGSGTETDWTDEVVLFRDGFYTIDSSSFRSTCYSYNCHYSSNRSVTSVGTWTVAGGAGTYSLATLRGAGWTFTPSTLACPGP